MPRAEPTAAAPEILVETSGRLKTIVLNRPDALNALTLEMVREMTRLLDEFERDPGTAYVLLKGAGNRGLCAGGDIRTLYQALLAHDDWPEIFWSEEYALNARIASYSKPYIALMDGIVMGGGVGVSAHARYRIVTERSQIAMPEVGIGLIPDVGGTWLLSRSPGELGTFLALTGTTMSGPDAIDAGFADFYIPSGRVEQLAGEISALPQGSADGALQQVMRHLEAKPPRSALEAHRELIDSAFVFDTVEEIQLALSSSSEPYAAEVLASMRGKSPSSLKVTLRLLRLAREATSLEECLEREFAAVLEAARRPDLTEGIRAAVIDKDRNPKWQPAKLIDVREADITTFLVKKTRRSIPFQVKEAAP